MYYIQLLYVIFAMEVRANYIEKNYNLHLGSSSVRFKAPFSSAGDGMGVVVYLGMNALMIFFFLKTPTAAVLAAGAAALF